MGKEQELFEDTWRIRLQEYPESLEFKQMYSFWREKLLLPERKLSTPVMVLFVGIPGSGKTFLSKMLQQNFIPAIHLKPDDIYFPIPELSYKGLEAANDYYKAYVIQEALAAEYLSAGYSVIMDDNYRAPNNRQQIYNLAEKHTAHTLLFCLTGITALEATKRILQHDKIKGRERPFAKLFQGIQTVQDETIFPTRAEAQRAQVFYKEINMTQSFDQIKTNLETDVDFQSLLQ